MPIQRTHRKLSLAAMAIFFGVTLVLLVGEQWYYGRRDIAQDMTGLARIVGANASAALVFGDRKAGEEILQALVHSENLVEAGLYRKDGTPLAIYRKSALPLTGVPLAEILQGPSPSFSLQEIHLAVPVILHGDVVGTTVIRASQDELYENLARFIAGYVLILVCAYGLAVLVTRRLRSKVAASERLFDGFFNAAPAGMALLDRDMRYLRINAALAAINGVPTADHLGRTVGEVIPELADFIGKQHRKVMATGCQQAIEFSGPPANAPDENRHWLNIFFPILDAEGGVVACGCVVHDVTELKNYQEEIEHSRRLLQRLMSHRESLVEEEYKKIAGEIHDDLGQVLTAALMRLRLLKRKLATTTAPQETELIDDIDGLLNEAYGRLKDIAATLRPAALSFGFAPAIEWLANRILGASAVQCHLDIDAALPKMAEPMSLALFRIIQESLTNAVRHAEAKNIWISLVTNNADWVLSIRDDGRGFRNDELGKSIQFGLLGIRERAASLGGVAIITGTLGQGVEIKVVVPRPTAD